MNKKFQFKIRYNSPAIEGTILKDDISYFVKLQNPAYAITGQLLTAYNTNKVILGAIIK